MNAQHALRQLLSIAVLPFTMTVLVPWWIAARNGTRLQLAEPLSGWIAQGAGVAALGIGLLLFAASLRQFIVRGRGTLAPWDPPTRLVVDGPYRYVRNPMISGVAFILLGEALILRSWPHALWVIVFVTINAIYIPLLEEPPLTARFGDAYRDYCRHVPRIVPRLTPWR
jgi:protein-S-isoprenylcysteine O-methyltransferase Ste14